MALWSGFTDRPVSILPRMLRVEHGKEELVGDPARHPDQRQDVLRAFRIVERHHATIEQAWRKTHG